MAFKMKGSAFKLNKVATKSTMKMAKKAMKMKEESAMDMKEKSPMELKTSYKMKEAMAKMKDESAMKQTKPDYPDIDGDGNTKESMKQAAADKKSPMEQGTKFTDKLKAFGTAITSKDGLMAVDYGPSKAIQRYKKEKKKYRTAAANKKGTSNLAKKATSGAKELMKQKGS